MQNYARFADNEAIKKNLTRVDRSLEVNKSGIPFFHDDDNIYVDTSEAHNLVIGSTGSGKTQTTVLPQLRLSLLAGESMVVVDEMGDVYSRLGAELKKNKYKVQIINFQDTSKSNNFNPLLAPYKLYKNKRQDDAFKMLEDIADIIYKVEGRDMDPFWINSAKNYFVGLCLYLFEKAKPEEISFNSIFEIALQIEEKGKAKEILEDLPSTSPAAINLSGTLLAPTETRGGIVSVFKQILNSIISRTQLSSLLSSSDVDLENLLEDKFAIFIIGEPHGIVSKFESMIINEIYDLTNVQGRRSKRLNVILDRFTELEPITSFHNILSRSRSLNIRFTLLIDSYTSLELVYGREESIQIINNIASIIYLLSTDDNTVRKMSRFIGEQAPDVPLVSPQELKTLKMFEAIIVKTREYPIKTKLLPDFQIPWNMSEEEMEFPTRKETDLKIYKI